MPFEFDYNKLLDLSKAHLRNYNPIGLNSDKEVTVYYDVALGSGTEAINWLQENRKTVRDVRIDHQQIEGLWRSIDVKSEQSTSNKEGVTVVQTFRFGFIEELTSGGNIVWDEARLVRGNEWHEGSVNGEFIAADTDAYSSTNPQKYFVVEWQGLNPEKVETIRQAVRDTPPSGVSPVINGEALGSGFFVLDVITEIEQDFREKDKSAKLTAIIAKPRFNLQAWESYGTPASGKIFYLFDVPVLIAQSIINIYNKRTGATASATQPNERGLVNITVRDTPDEDIDDAALSDSSCAFYTLATYYHNVTAPVDVPDNEMGITYRSRFDMIRQTGLYSGSIEKRVRQTQKVGPYRSENTHGHTVTETAYSGAYLVGGNYYHVTLSFDGTDIVQAGLPSGTPNQITFPDNTLALGDTWNVKKNVNDDCTEDLLIQERDELDIDDITYDSSDSNTEHTESTEKLNKESADITLTAGSNQVLRANVRYNKDTGLLDSTINSTVSKETEGQDVEKSASQTRTVTKAFMTDTVPTTPVQEDGKVKAISYEETEFAGRYRASESVIEAINQRATGGQARADQTSAIEKETQSATEAAATPIAGKIVVVDNSPTEFGRYSTRTEVITPINQTANGAELRADRTSDTETNTQSDTEADETPVLGAIVQTQNRPTEFGKYATSRTVITPIAQTTTHDSTARADQTAERTIATNAEAKQDATPVAGKIVNATSKENEFGKFDNTLETITPYDQTANGAEIRADRISDVETHTQSDTEADETPVEGVIIQTSNSPTEFGKYRTSRTVITPVKQTTTHDSTARADQTAERTIETNADAKQDAVPVAGKIVNATSKENEFGKFDNTLETITPYDQSATGVESRADRTSATETHTQADAEADGTPITGYVVQTSNSPTEFGKYRTSRTLITPLTQTTEHISQSRADQTAERTIVTNAAAIQDATAQAGKVVTASSRENEFGKYDNQLDVITPVDQTDTDTQDSAAQSVSAVKHTQADDEVVAGTAATGTIVRASNQETEFGKHRTVLETITAKDQIGGGEEFRADQEATTITHTQGDEVTVIATAGKIVSSVNRPTEFGKFATTEVEISPINQESTDDHDDLYIQRSTEKDTQNDSIPPSSFSTGVITRVEAQPTEFGKFRTSVQTLTAQAVSDAARTTEADYFRTVRSETDRNQLVAGNDIIALDGTTIKTSRWTRNEFDLYDNTLEEIDPIARDSGWIDVPSRWGTDKKREFRNQTLAWMTGTLIPDFDSDYNNSLSFSMNAHSLYDGSASRTAYQGSGETDTWLIGPQESYRYKQEFTTDKSKETNVDGLEQGVEQQRVRYHKFKITTHNRGTYGEAESEIKDWAQTAPYPMETGITPITLKTGQRLYQAHKTEYYGSTVWSAVSASGQVDVPT